MGGWGELTLFYDSVSSSDCAVFAFWVFKASVQNCKILENKLEEKHHDNVGRNRNRNLGKF